MHFFFRLHSIRIQSEMSRVKRATGRAHLEYAIEDHDTGDAIYIVIETCKCGIPISKAYVRKSRRRKKTARRSSIPIRPTTTTMKAENVSVVQTLIAFFILFTIWIYLLLLHGLDVR